MQFLKVWYWRACISLIIGQMVVEMFEGFNDYIFIGTIILSYIFLSAIAKKM